MLRAVGLSAQLAVGLTFLTSGAGKFSSAQARSDFRESFTRLTRLKPSLSWLVGAIEIPLGLWTIIAHGGPARLAPAFLTLVALSFVLLSALRRGDTSPCNCFGSVTSLSLDWSPAQSLSRNLLLLAMLGLATRDLPPDYHSSADVAAVVLALTITTVIVNIPALSILQPQDKAR